MNSCLSWLFSWLLPPEVAYAEACRRTCSLDLVYFCQLGNWTGPFVAFFSGKLITHMGVAWRHPQTNELYVLESVRHPDTAGDVVNDGRVHTGVRLVSFREKLRNPSDRYFVCVQPIIMERALRERAEERLAKFILEENSVPFERNVSCFWLAQLPRSWRLHAREDTASLFCSEMAALALRDCGLLRGVDNVSTVWPSMLYNCQLQLEPGAHLCADKFMVRMDRRPLLRRRAPAPPLLPPPPAAAAAASDIDELTAILRDRGITYNPDLIP